jgi:hypothetical protein
MLTKLPKTLQEICGRTEAQGLKCGACQFGLGKQAPQVGQYCTHLTQNSQMKVTDRCKILYEKSIIVNREAFSKQPLLTSLCSLLQTTSHHTVNKMPDILTCLQNRISTQNSALKRTEVPPYKSKYYGHSPAPSCQEESLYRLASAP